MQWLAIDFQNVLTSARLGTLTLTPKIWKKIQFQISPEKLENGLSTSKSTPENPYVDFITIQKQKLPKFLEKLGLRNSLVQRVCWNFGVFMFPCALGVFFFGNGSQLILEI